MNGIPVSLGFDRKTADPLDKYSTVANLTELFGIPDVVRYSGMTVFVQNSNAEYWLPDNDLSNNRWVPKQSVIEEQSTKVFSGAIPAIEPSNRAVFSVNLGILRFNKQAVVSFIKDTVSEADIVTGKLNPYDLLRLSKPIDSTRPNLPAKLINNYLLSANSNLIIVNQNHLKTRRLNNAEMYERVDAGVVQSQGMTYEIINTGILFGWYTLLSSFPGVLGLTKKVVFESAWLEQNEDKTTTMYFALRNIDTAANAPLSYKIAVYD